MGLFTREFPKNARIYLLSVIGLGSGVLAYSLYESLFSSDLSWLLLASMTVVGSFFAVRIPFGKDGKQSLSITVSDVFIFASILLYSPSVAVSIAFVDGLMGTYRTAKRQLYKVVFNLTQLALVTFSVGHLFYRLQGTGYPLTPGSISDQVALFFVNLGFCALTYFVLNSSVVAMAIALVTRRPFVELWKTNFLWASITNFSGASTAAIIFLVFERTQFYAVGIAIPIVLVIYSAYKINLKRISETEAHVKELNRLYHSTIASLAMAIDAKDQCTHGHVHRVQALTLGLARHCGITDENQLEGLKAAALLHDIGKLAIPEYILNKPSPLTEAEMTRMKVHPSVGADILATVPFPYPVVPFVRHHHERWDGSGYPDGLSGEEIPLGARILSIADCYDALTSDRPYRPALSREVALGHIQAKSGQAYDPAIVDILTTQIDDLENQLEAGETSAPSSLVHKIEDAMHPDRVERKISKTVFHDIASAHKEIQAVYEISQTVGKSLNVSETLTLLSSKIKGVIPYSTCVVYLTNSGDDRLLPHHVSGIYSEMFDTLEFRLGDGVSGWVGANNQPLFNVSPAPDFMHTRLLVAEFNSCLSVPLSLNENVVGVITVYSTAPNAFDRDHLRFMESIAHYAAMAINNAIIYEETQEDAFTDILTGLPNLRYFGIFIDQELKRAARVSYPVTILLMDLDYFKEVNDRYGHRVGDRMLVEIAHILRNQLRKSDTCIRYGGDEFLGVLPGMSKELANQTILRIQAAVDGHRIILDDDNSAGVGISIGSATYPVDGQDMDTLISIADQAMYRNKLLRRSVQSKSNNIAFLPRPADRR